MNFSSLEQVLEGDTALHSGLTAGGLLRAGPSGTSRLGQPLGLAVPSDTPRDPQ